MDVNQIITGDALEVLSRLPDASIQCCVTSPPYFGLRDYGVEGQIGLEETPEKYVSKLVEVFREVKRTLRDDGVLWLNLGDSYAGSWGNYAPRGIKGEQRPQTEEGKRWEREAYSDTSFLPPTANPSKYGLKPKDLIGIPWMVAFALRADGWYLRSDIIWSKPNCMPESVEDRPTKSHEYIFLFAKSERYYYDTESIKENVGTLTRRAASFRNGGVYTNNRSFFNSASTEKETYGDGESSLTGRNKRTVWTVASQPYPESHFATFPPKLIEPCILSSSSPKACEHCGSPWERVTEPTGHINKREIAHVPNNTPTKIDSTGWAPTRQSTNQWQPTCICSNEGTGKCIVLDPFAGAGTTALVALQHGRNYLGIELNPSYVQLAEKRIATVQQNLWTSGSEAIAV